MSIDFPVSFSETFAPFAHAGEATRTNVNAFQDLSIVFAKAIEFTNWCAETTRLLPLIKACKTSYATDLFGLPHYLKGFFLPYNTHTVHFENFKKYVLDLLNTPADNAQEVRDGLVKFFEKDLDGKGVYGFAKSDEFVKAAVKSLYPNIDKSIFENLNEVPLKRVVWQEYLTTLVWNGVGVGCLISYVHEWDLINLGAAAAHLGQAITAGVGVGFALQLWTTWEAFHVPISDDPEVRTKVASQVIWDRVSSVAMLLVYSATLAASLELVAVSAGYLLAGLFAAKGIGLLKCLFKPKSDLSDLAFDENLAKTSFQEKIDACYKKMMNNRVADSISRVTIPVIYALNDMCNLKTGGVETSLKLKSWLSFYDNTHAPIFGKCSAFLKLFQDLLYATKSMVTVGDWFQKNPANDQVEFRPLSTLNREGTALETKTFSRIFLEIGGLVNTGYLCLKYASLKVIPIDTLAPYATQIANISLWGYSIPPLNKFDSRPQDFLIFVGTSCGVFNTLHKMYYKPNERYTVETLGKLTADVAKLVAIWFGSSWAPAVIDGISGLGAVGGVASYLSKQFKPRAEIIARAA